MDEALSRQALYDLLWSEPIKAAAQRLGVPEVAIKKACASGDVPVPYSGYWTKLAAGQPTRPIALPCRAPGANEMLRIGEPDYQASRATPEAQLAKPLPKPPRFDESLESVRARSQVRLGAVKHVRDLSSPWAGLRQILQEDQKRAARQRSEKSASPWNKPLFESGFEKRRLRILNSLGLGMAKARARIEVRGKAGRDVSVLVGDTRVPLRLDHPLAEPDRQGQWQVRQGPADTLRLMIGPSTGRADGYQVFWEDVADDPLEERLSAVALEILVAGEAEFRAEAGRAHARQLQYRAQLAQTMERRRVEPRKQPDPPIAFPQQGRQHLLTQAAEWRAAQDVRGFVAAALARSDATQSLMAWATWALAEADALDPVTSQVPIFSKALKA